MDDLHEANADTPVTAEWLRSNTRIRGWLALFMLARLISARQFRYKTPTSLKMMKAKENILLYLGDFATCSQMSRYC